MEGPSVFLNMILAILADSLEANQGRGDLKDSYPLGMAIGSFVIILILTVVYFGIRVRHKRLARDASLTKCSLAPGNETTESHN